MAPLIVLLLTFALACIHVRRSRNWALAGRIALAVMLFVTALAHFVDNDSLVAMLPPWAPWRRTAVYATGVTEMGFAGWLLLRPRPVVGWLLLLFFFALFPANVYSAVERTGLGGYGPAYLWFRAPLQVLFCAWALLCTGAVTWRHHGADTQRSAGWRLALDVCGSGERCEQRRASSSRTAPSARS